MRSDGRAGARCEVQVSVFCSWEIDGVIVVYGKDPEKNGCGWQHTVCEVPETSPVGSSIVGPELRAGLKLGYCYTLGGRPIRGHGNWGIFPRK